MVGERGSIFVFVNKYYVVFVLNEYFNWEISFDWGGVVFGCGRVVGSDRFGDGSGFCVVFFEEISIKIC